MKCPKCSSAKCRYKQRKPEKTRGNNVTFKRTIYTAECKCGWKGEI